MRSYGSEKPQNTKRASTSQGMTGTQISLGCNTIKFGDPVEASKSFFGLILQMLKLRYNCEDHIFIPFVFLQFTIHLILQSNFFDIHNSLATL